jgi:predicted nucleic acid-binding protein
VSFPAQRSHPALRQRRRASLRAHRRRAGRPISQFDAQIAAIARSMGATIATRDVAGYEGCGVKVVNPWKD